jgi:hypothetical protein
MILISAALKRELKHFADDCAKLHAAAVAAEVSIAQGTPQPGTARRPSWLHLARHASGFYGFSVLSQDARVPDIRAKAYSLRACTPRGRPSRPTMHPSRRGSVQGSRPRIPPVFPRALSNWRHRIRIGNFFELDGLASSGEMHRVRAVEIDMHGPSNPRIRPPGKWAMSVNVVKTLPPKASRFSGWFLLITNNVSSLFFYVIINIIWGFF